MYDAMVVKLTHIARIEGADRIVSAKVNNGSVDIATVIVGIESEEGSAGIYFSPDTQLSEEYCHANDLLAIYDESGKKIGGGYFSKNRRVTAQKFKGVRSEGLFMPLSSLNFMDNTAIPLMRFGDTFTEINGVEICRKYFNEKTMRERSAKTSKKETKVISFPEHVDTEQLIYRIDDIPVGARITITEKLHGTSHRVGNVLVKQKLSRVKRFVNWFCKAVSNWWDSDSIFKDTAYEIVHGSRRVIIDDSPGYYGSNDFRFKAVGNLTDIPQDMILYGEIVGYVDNTPIMNPHATKDYKELKKEYGATITYNYGCNPGEAEFVIYRITQNGNDLSWQDVQNWANVWGYAVPYTFTSFIYDGMTKEELLEIVKNYAEYENGYSKSKHGDHISEGVVLRIDYNDKVWFLKYKSFMFKALEGIIKDSGVVDMEEVG